MHLRHLHLVYVVTFDFKLFEFHEPRLTFAFAKKVNIERKTIWFMFTKIKRSNVTYKDASVALDKISISF